MRAKELRKYKQLLDEKREELQMPLTSAGAVIPGAGGFEADFLDQATADAEAELQIQLRQTDGRLFRAIEDAIARMKHGTYGVCELCKRPISKARLDAVPWTHVCRKCKEQRDA
jgi:DnaK suppressor protein